MGSVKYPILLVHGIGFHDQRIFNYWGRIPKRLTKQGAQIFYGCQDSHASVESNAHFLYQRVLKIIEETGAEKINVIAHSKGGLDSRWMISHLDHGRYVASLTTLSTPHRGSHTVDVLLRMPDRLVRIVSFFCDRWYGLLGDKHPESYRMFHELATEPMKHFNQQTPNAEGVYYQSYAFVMKHFFSDFIMALPFLVVKAIEGPSDGLVTPESAAWGEFRGIYTGNGWKGISHCDVVDRRRRRLSKKEPTNAYSISDMVAFYFTLIKELKNRGL